MKFIFALCLLLSMPVFAGTAIIINANNTSGIDVEMVKRIYLGKSKAFPDGSRAIPLTFETGNGLRDIFNKNVLGKSESQYSAFWSKLVFTGRGTPPEMISNEDEMLTLVATNPNTIGFIDESKVDGSVKIVGTF
ncbi:phosphate ABC transporter substrate-binding protein [Alteromonas sp.]|uniref:phosphate ABC transporter substrate-binding protein n=1 Tax=Alteromonas sp. TaxID=232 RepID=UPI000B6C2D45|nr:phosphate ABC transporter substrate-binding protein [Alteromonas sp.]MAI37236.1 phosphate ABC transporter substrate-binding protein [Alteromonas sp.]OUX89074.1 MAG: phosphate ABC transporter substrate-binding protein [Alteromonas sp. TMED35]|tara:strand:+ start:10091 stop:10495 length:405 start_codon:yes stop_codon:yes gene_type:complete